MCSRSNAMDKVRVLMLMLLFTSFSAANGVDEEEQSKKATWWEWQGPRSAYSVYSARFPTSIGIGHYWYMVKALVNQAYERFFPPNIDFRRGDEAQGVTDNGAGEKVKEALAQSLGTSKATLEDAAKSAATIAGETIEKAKEKVKRSLSEDRERKHQKEL